MVNKKNEIINISHLLSSNEVSSLSKNPSNEQISKIQEELLDERKSRKTERFSWILAGTILLDCLIFPPLTNGILTFISILELILLLTLANAYELELPAILLKKLLKRMGIDY